MSQIKYTGVNQETASRISWKKRDTKMKITMKLERLALGAVRYMEVDATGERITNREVALIGTLYIRKTAFVDGHFPTSIEVSITNS